MKAWYFSNAERTLRHGDGRDIAVGVTHEVDGAPVLCERGLHGSRLLLDALEYAPGPIVWRVELGGKLVKGTDKAVAQRRTYIGGGVDITDALWAFARKCALDVVHLWDAPSVVIDYLKTGDEELRSAARSAAWSAVSDAAWSAARFAAWSAARFAVSDAARFAASDAARFAARYATWYAAKHAARARQNRRLTSMVVAAIKAQS